MLTHNDVHLLVGMLSLITSPDDVEVELGSRVLDASTGTRRGVDITMTARQPDGTVAAYAGIEVKDETQPLGTPTVEQLIAKLGDMPSIAHRSIVSSSGYTAPARAKAAHHGVTLLNLCERERGKRIYPFLSPDLNASIQSTLFRWASQPTVQVATIGGPAAEGLPDSTLVLSGDGRVSTTLAQLVDTTVQRLLTSLQESGSLDDLSADERRRIRRQVEFSPAWKVDQSERIVGLVVDGEVIAYHATERPVMKLLVDEATGEPHAACLVGVLPTNDLVGAVFTAGDINPHLIKIPVKDRNLKVIHRMRLR